MLKKIKNHFKERIKKLVRSELKIELEKYIVDVNDLKSDYLKKYLESRMNNNNLSIDRLDSISSELSNRLYALEERINEKEDGQLDP